MASPRALAVLLIGWLLLGTWAVGPVSGADGANAPAAAEALLDDPGLDPGTGTPLDLAAEAADPVRLATGVVDLGASEPGAHTLYVRVQDQAGDWSAPIGQTLHVVTTVGAPSLGGLNTLVDAEAFIDTDPGEGLGTPLAVGDGTWDGALERLLGVMDLSGLEVGSHTLYVRAQDGSGLWSAPIGQTLLVVATGGGPPAGGANTLTAAEAFLDQDPGEGQGVPLAAGDGDFDSVLEHALATLDLSGLDLGAHTLYVRTRDASGLWSAPLGQTLTVVPGVGGSPQRDNRIVEAEVFIDRDPGQGRGIPLPVAADGSIGDVMEVLGGTAALTGLPQGPHVLAVRFRDSSGLWSAPIRQSLFVTAALSAPGSGPTRLVAAEGQVDGGAPFALPADDGAFGDVVETASMDWPDGDGYHAVSIRFQDSLGLWSDTVSSGGGCIGGIPLSGRLLDGATGTALAGVAVSAGGITVSTGADGGFSITGLGCGPQVVRVSRPGFAVYQRTFDPAIGGWLEIRLVAAGADYGLGRDSGYSGDPVNTATGNYVYEQEDLALPGPGVPLRFTRAYNSRAASEVGAPGAPLGYGWTHGYRITLARDADRVVTTWGDGHTETFASDGAGGFLPQYGVSDTLTDNGDGTFTLGKRDGTRYVFDTDGRVASISDRNDNTLTLAYAGANLTQITDSVGRVITLDHDGAGRITQIVDPLGRTLRFTYDANGDLIEAEDPNGNLTQYTYDDRHQILSVVDPRGHTLVSNTYDADRRVVTYQTDAKGGATTYAYGEADGITTITDALGGVTVHYHDDLLRLTRSRDPLGAESWFVYDEAGNRVQVVDNNGNLTEYAYDARGNVTRARDALGGVTTITYDDASNPLTRTDALGHTTRFTYDPRGNLIETVDAAGGRETVTYDARGLVLTRTDALGRTTTFAYDGHGNPAEVTDALGGLTRFTYDGVGRRMTRTDALGRTTRYAYDANDNLLSVTDPAGGITRYAYDANDNRLRVTDRLGNTTDFAYDEKDLLVSMTDAAGGVLANTYDALNRKIAARNRRGHETLTDYDAAGRAVQVTDALGATTLYGYDANGNRTSATDPLGHRTSFLYDALNRLVAQEDPLGHMQQLGYDALGRVTSRTDAAGQVTQLRYDPVGRLTEVIDAAGGRVTYAYDLVGNRLSMTGPNGHTTRYAYDALDRRISQTEPLGNTTSYAYDAVGNLASVTKPDGSLIQYEYDVLDRRTAILYPDGSETRFTYDAEGRRTAMQDGIGTTTWAYDALARMTRYVDPYGNQVGYAYDAEGNRTRVTYPGAKAVDYVFDAENRLVSVTDWLGQATVYTYDAAGRLGQAVNGNRTGALYGYDAADRLTSLHHHRAAAGTIAAYAYTLDAVGNTLAEQRDEPLAPSLTESDQTYVYDAEDRLSEENGVANAFDAKGNQTRSGDATYGYDFDDRLVRAETGVAQFDFGYNGLGQRLFRVANGLETRFVLDPSGPLSRVLMETDASGTPSAYYVHGLGLTARIAADGATRWYHYDSRGSTVALTNGSGVVTDSYAYDPYGVVLATSGGTANPFRYVGREGLMDDGSGLLYVRARYYDPDTGRFVSKDPKPGEDTESQSLNRYLYGLANPVRFVDVTGWSAREGRLSRSTAESSDQAHHWLLSGLGWNSFGEGVLKIGGAAGKLTVKSIARKWVYEAQALRSAGKIQAAAAVSSSAGRVSTAMSVLTLGSVAVGGYREIVDRGYTLKQVGDAWLNAGENIRFGIENPDELLRATTEGVTSTTAITINVLTLGITSFSGKDVERAAGWVSEKWGSACTGRWCGLGIF